MGEAQPWERQKRWKEMEVNGESVMGKTKVFE